MSSLNELAFRILESVRPEIINDDSIDIREIKHDICIQRALWIKNELYKNREVSASYIQDLGCVELEIADRGECCNISTGCKILRTKELLPKPIEQQYGEFITRVGPIDKLAINYNYIPYAMAAFSGNGRFNSDSVFAFYKDRRIYISSKEKKIRGLKYINIQGVFYDPRDVSVFTTCTGTSCYTDDMEFPITEYIIPYIEGEIIKKYSGVELKLPVDSSPDNSPKVTTQQQ